MSSSRVSDEVKFWELDLEYSLLAYQFRECNNCDVRGSVVVAYLPHHRTMDLPLHSGRLSECGARSRHFSRLLDLSRGFIPIRARNSARIVNSSARIRDAGQVCTSRGSRRFVPTHSATRIPSETSYCECGRFGRSRRRGILTGKVPGRSKFGIVYFEQRDRNCSDASTSNADRPPFDLDLAVVLAGFAFEAYNTPGVCDLPNPCPLFSNIISSFRCLQIFSDLLSQFLVVFYSTEF